MKMIRLFAIGATAIACVACSTPASQRSAAPDTQPAASGDAPKANTRVVKSRDGKYTGEIIGTLRPNSRFAKLQIGMEGSEVQQILGRAPDRVHSYESGKRWIPFYFGNDARRVQAMYKGEGCLVFTGGNPWGGGGGDLIQIEADPSGACYQP